MTQQYQPTGSTQSYGQGGQQTYGQGGQQTYESQQSQMSGMPQSSQMSQGGMKQGGMTQGRTSQGGFGTQQMGQETGASHETTHRTVGRQFESEMTPELNEALESFDRVVEIAEWCADKCIESGPEMAECARLCEDLADLASLNEKLIARDSINGPEVAEAFLKVAQQGMPILQQYQQSYHVKETLDAVQQSVDATNKLLSSIGGTQGSPQTGIREQAQQGTQGQQFQPQDQSFQQSRGQSSQPQGQSFQGSQSY